jgi:putative aldouronate transport system substrate-binding protein
MRQANVAQKMVSGVSGASFGTLASRMGAWIQSAEAAGTPIDLGPAPFPVLRKGGKPKMNTTDIPYANSLPGAAISGMSKNTELATRLLDWGYGTAGHNFYNFGIEGESYKWVSGYPLYTDYVMNNPSWTIGQGVASYARAASTGPLLQDGRYQEQLFALDVQKDGMVMWPIQGADRYVVPPLSPTPEESSEFARIMNDVNTYQQEMESKFILGTEALTDSAWNNYIATLRRLGIDRAIEIQNAGLARYNKR